MFDIGTVLISRNYDESENTSPGYWNHCAIYIGDDAIIEAQIGQGVIRTLYTKYITRAYTWFPLRPLDLSSGMIAACRAKMLVGLPYRKLSSVWRHVHNENRGVNCVDAAFRIPYEYAFNQNFSFIHWPDDIINLVGLFIKGDEIN